MEKIFLCKMCGVELKTKEELIQHNWRKHKVNADKTVLEYCYNNITPVCHCGCGTEMKYFPSFKDYGKYVKGHISRVNNNYQTEKSISNSKKTKAKRAEEGIYKNIPKSEEHKEKIRQKSLLHRHSDESKEKISEFRKKWNKENPEKVNLHMKEYWKDPKHRFEQGIRTAKNLSTYHRVISKLEIEFEEILKELNIEYERQFRISKSLYDFKIKDKDILIEVDGDFWHSNPEMFPDGPIYKVQKDNFKRDQEKNVLAFEKGYSLIRIWEHEIKYTKDILTDKLKSLLIS